MSWDMILQIVESTLRMSVPLVFAAMAGVICERSGVINIALEGLILFGAFTAAATTVFVHDPWLGFLAAMLAGAVVSVGYAFFVIELRANQIISGTAVNMLALGLTPLFAKALFGASGSSPQLPLDERLRTAPLWLAAFLVPLVHLVFARLPLGLWISFAGQNPEALACSGVRPRRVRWTAVIVAGALAAAGGASLSIYLSSSFARQMSAGRGFMALAAMIFGRWQPVPAALACLLFGFTEALQIRLQGVQLPGMSSPVPVQFIQILPYVVTIVVLAGFVGKRGAPRALGRPLPVS